MSAKNKTDILRTKEMPSFALSSIPKGTKECAFHFTCFEATVLIRNDSLTSKEYTPVFTKSQTGV